MDVQGVLPRIVFCLEMICRYVKSRSDMQLANEPKNQATSLCDPQEFLNGNSSELINPCGLVAWSFFNDTYAVSARFGRGTGHCSS